MNREAVSWTEPKKSELKRLAALLNNEPKFRALEQIELALKNHPNDWRLHRLHCMAALEMKDAERLDAAITELSRCNPPAKALVRFSESLALMQDNHEQAACIIDEALREGQIEPSSKILRRLSIHWQKAKNWKASMTSLEQALESDPEASINIASLLVTLVELDVASLGEVEITRLRRRFPLNPYLLIAQCRLLLTTGKASGIGPLVEANRSILDESSLARLQSLISTTGIQIVSQSGSNLPAGKATSLPGSRRKDFIQLLDQNRYDEAEEMALSIEDERQKETCLQLLSRLPPPPQRKLVRNFQGQEAWVEATGSDSVAAVACFTGGAGLALSFPITFFDRYLAASNIDVIYMRDTQRNVFLGGVEGFADSASSMADKLRQWAGEKPLFGIGFSGGSFGVTNLVSHKNTSGALMFSPYTHLYSNNEKHKAAMHYLRPTFDSVPSNCVSEFSKGGAPCPMTMWYGTADSECIEQTERVQGIDNIVCHAVSGSQHTEVLFDLAARGDLLSILRKHLHVGR